jgi:hypothetical protein
MGLFCEQRRSLRVHILSLIAVSGRQSLAPKIPFPGASDGVLAETGSSLDCLSICSADGDGSIGLGARQSVRVLKRPPPIPALAEISRQRTNYRGVAAFLVATSVSGDNAECQHPLSGSLSLPKKFRFPETETVVGGDQFDSGLLSGQSQRLALQMPFRRQIGQTRHP